MAWKPLEVRITTRVTKIDATELRERTEIEQLPAPPEAQILWWPWLLALVPMLALATGVVYSRLARPGDCRCFRREAVLRTLNELERQTPTKANALSSWHARLADALRHYVEETAPNSTGHVPLPDDYRVLAMPEADALPLFDQI